MKHKKSIGGGDYSAPEITVAVVSVENGFANSPDPAAFDFYAPAYGKGSVME